MRRRLIAIALYFCAVLPASAAITGTVMNNDGQPIAGAKVEVFTLTTMDEARARLVSGGAVPQPIAATQTDAKGKFTLDSPKDPVVQLRVSANGYAPDSLRSERDDDVGALELTQAETKTGVVTANGKPLAGAKVIWTGGTEIIVTTDEKGRYSVPDPAKWTGRPVVIHPDYALFDDASTPRPASASPALDIALNAGAPLSGIVVGQDGKTPVAGATVLVDGWPLATTGQDGAFTIAHAPAKWQMIVVRSVALIGSRAHNGTAASTIRLARAASLTGSVREMKTQAPVAGAEVRVRTPMRFEASETAGAFTDAKGNFAISGILPGSYQLVVLRPGYSAQSLTISLKPNDAAHKTILATQMSRISGTVVDEQKRAVTAAHLRAQVVSRGEAMMFGPVTRGGHPSISAPDGSFALRVEPETDLELAAVRKGYPPARSTRMRLAPGEHKSGLVLTIPSGIAVSGRVTDKDGKPVAGVSVTATDSDRSGGRPMMIRRFAGGQRDRGDDTVKSSSDGTFTIRLKEGTYDLGFEREGFAVKTVRAVRVGTGAAKPVEVALEPGVEITGRVTRSGAGVEGVRIDTFGEVDTKPAETGSDGSFRITGLSPGEITLNLTKPDEFIHVIRPVKAPASDVNVEIPAGGRVSGRVVDKATSQPVTSFDLGLNPTRGGGGFTFMTTPALRHFTSDDGSFTLDNVPAGQVQLVVNAAGYTTAHSSTVTLEEGKSLSDVEVQLDSGVHVTGKVTGPGGSPIAGVEVFLQQQPGRAMRAVGMPQNTVTDENGEYSMDAIEPGDKTFMFSRAGFVTTSKAATLSGPDARVDVQLSSGMRITGTVVTDTGIPVADAGVNAIAPGYVGPTPNTTTDANGSFAFESLAPGIYNFIAAKQGYTSGNLRDVDITSGAPVRITLQSGGTITGHVTGLTPDEMQRATVIASGQNGGSSAAVDGSGNFRIDGAPTGTVRVSGRTGMGLTGGKTSPVQSIQLETGGSAQVDIVFKSDTVISGHVTRNGRPVEGAMVAFFPKAATAQTSARTSTDSNGQYEVSGLDDATYNVSVVDIQRSAPVTTTYEVRGSGNFDIDMKAATLRGHVSDSDGNAVSDAVVEVRDKGDTDFRFARGAQTDSAGTFVLPNVPPGTYSVTGSKQGYSTKVTDTVVDDGGGNVELTLSKNDGVVLYVVDARNGQALNARVHVTNAQNATVYDTPPAFGGSAANGIKLPLEPGSYTASIFVPGYAPQTMSITSPSNPRVALTPGGSIAIQSQGSARRRARLLNSDGTEYGRGGFGGIIFTVDPSPGKTVINNIAPGTYTLQILGDGNQVTASSPVTVVEGQQATVSI
ncbi:MAG TPA: carboxypeptidase regulatory-like domain-containing protein [Thermoanaerobaculia bacterium]